MMVDEMSSAFVKGTHLRKILERTGPFCTADFDPGLTNLDFISNVCRILVIGCGGLGCELLPKLALMGFNQIDVIDMDTIDLSNLNRQFLFRHKDIGKSKAEVAADYINSRLPGIHVTAHFCRIQDKDDSFYRQFHIIISGLDSIIARRWINGMLIGLLEYDEETQELDRNSVIPLIDGGTEGFKGNVRVIMPGETACIECTLSLFPPQVNFPLCTIANTPRLPEHCIEYAKVLLWSKENPFGGAETPIDTDDPNHINWLYERALERAKQFNIEGVTYRLTSGVIKNIIPAVASTNALIAASCVTEAFKLATSCHETMNNYMIFNDTDGIYTYTYQQERNAECIACSPTSVVKTVAFRLADKLQAVVDFFCESTDYQMKAPGLTTTNSDGSNKTLYMQSVPALEQMTRPNLAKTLQELELADGQNLFVADSTTPNTMTFKLKLS